MAIIRQIILASFFAASVFAAPAITLEKHTAEGQMQNAFTQLDGKWVFVKNSNYFDKKEESLGEFSIKNPESLEKPTEALENSTRPSKNRKKNWESLLRRKFITKPIIGWENSSSTENTLISKKPLKFFRP